MTQPQINIADIHKIAHAKHGNQEVVSLWTKETQPLNLFQKNSKDEEKIARLTSHFEKNSLEFKRSISEAIEKVLEPDFKQSEIKLFPGDSIETIINLEEKFCFKWSSQDASLTGLYALNKNLFFKIYDLLFGGKRLYIKKGTLTAFEKESLLKMIDSLHVVVQGSLSSVSLPLINITEEIVELGNASKEYANSNRICVVNEITIAEESLGQFEIILPIDVLKPFSDGNEELGDKNAADNAVNQSIDNSFINAVSKCIQDVQVTVKVELGSAWAPLKEILTANTESQWPLYISDNGHKVNVEGQEFGLASMGEANGMRAIQIIERY